MAQKKPTRKPKKKVLPTIETHLKKNLTGEELKKALKNTLAARKKIHVAKFSEAIFQAFQFGDTPEGFEYWKVIFDRAKAKENGN